MIPGSQLLTDPREIFVTIASALTGPIGAIITSVISTLYDPSPDLQPYVAVQHILPSILLTFSYRYIIVPHLGKPNFYLYWALCIVAYYYVFYLPVYVITSWFFPVAYSQINLEGLSFWHSIIRLYTGWLPEICFTVVITTLYIFVLPDKLLRPLWGNNGGTSFSLEHFSFSNFKKVADEFRGLSLRIFLLVLLVLIIPVISIVIIVRNSATEQWLKNEGNTLLEIAAAHSLISIHQKDSLVSQRRRFNSDYSEFILDLTSGEIELVSGHDLDLFSRLYKSNAELLNKLERESQGIWSNKREVYAAGFFRNYNTEKVYICFSDGDEFKAIANTIPINLPTSLGTLLLICASLIAVFLRIIVSRPVKTISEFADSISYGRYLEDLKTDEMEDEIKELSASLNRMQWNINSAFTSLEEREFLLMTVLANTPVIHFVLGQDGIFKLVLGKSMQNVKELNDDLIGKHYSQLAPHPDFYSAIESAYNGKVFKGVIHINNRVLDLYICPLFALEKIVDSVIGLAHDITAQAELENQLRQAVTTAEQSDKLKTELLANLSHEFRTPMNGVLGYSAILLEDENRTETRDMLKKIRKSSMRLMRTLNSVITRTEIESGVIQPTLQPVALSLVAAEAMKPYRTDAEDKNLAFSLEELSPNLIVSADTELLKQLLYNIIDNGIKFTNTGSITLYIRSKTIDNIPSACICVADTGVGIDREHYEIIFNQFKQLSEGYSRKFEGLGLGLSNAKKMATLIGATISVESRPEGGSVFTVSFPI